MDRELIEGIDYYFENGLMVFSEYYLRERGYCCTSGCRHCPYGFAKIPTPTIEKSTTETQSHKKP